MINYSLLIIFIIIIGLFDPHMMIFLLLSYLHAQVLIIKVTSNNDYGLLMCNILFIHTYFIIIIDNTLNGSKIMSEVMDNFATQFNFKSIQKKT